MVRYVIKINANNMVMYLQYETPGTIDPKTHQTLKEPMGWFTNKKSCAKRINDKDMAIAISKAYDDSVVEEVYD